MKYEIKAKRSAYDWHPTFLWFPATIEGYFVWLEWVECRAIGQGGGPPETVYEYRIPVKGIKP